MNLFKSFSVYALSSFLVSGISFFLLPVFTRHLKPEDYGTLGLVTTTISLITPLIGLASNGSVQAQYFKIGREKIGSFTFSAFVNNLLAFVIVTVVLLLVFPFVNDIIKISLSWFILIPLITLFTVIPQIVLTLYQTEKKPFQFAAFSIFQAITNLGLGILFVVTLKWNWEGRALSILITAVLSAIIGIMLLAKNQFLSFRYDRKFAREALSFGLPLIPHSIGYFIIDSSDRYFIAGYVGSRELGYYNVAYQLCYLVGVVDGAFCQAWVPFLYERLSEKSTDSDRRIAKMGAVYAALLICAVVGLILTAPLLFKFYLGKDYSPGLKFIPWIALSYFFVGVYRIFAGFIFYFNKNVYLTYISFVNIGLNILLNIIFIEHYGALGAAFATLISCFVTAVAVYFFSQKVYPLNWLKAIREKAV
jgi:O-antigen/teichoic acid export membrane protein